MESSTLKDVDISILDEATTINRKLSADVEKSCQELSEQFHRTIPIEPQPSRKGARDYEGQLLTFGEQKAGENEKLQGFPDIVRSAKNCLSDMFWQLHYEERQIRKFGYLL